MAVEFGRRVSQDAGVVAVDASGGRGAGDGEGGSDSRTAQDWLRFAAQLAAASLAGFGLILWIAAHWDEISRFGRLGIVGGALAGAVLLSLLNAARVPGLILSFLATGGLFALIGQTYQTGADPWQLFAVWAAIGVPWALAARSDALWVVWVVVASLAIGLWLASNIGPRVSGHERVFVVAAWLYSLAITVPLSPFVGLRRWLGSTRWAFRLAALLFIVLVTQSGVSDLFMERDTPVLYWLALGILGGAAIALLTARALDIVLLSVLGLSLDTLLITGFARVVLQAGALDYGSFLLIGVVGAGLVAATGAYILMVMREQEAGPDLAALKGQEWPVILMTGIGALLTTIPLGGGLGLLFGVFLTTGLGPYILGAGILAGSVAVIRGHAQTSFLHQLGAIGLTLGYCLIAFGLTRDMHGSLAPVSAALAVLAVGVAATVGASWTAALLGAAAGASAGIFCNQLFSAGIYGLMYAQFMAPFGWSVLLAAGAAWLVWSEQETKAPRMSASFAALPPNAGRIAGGAITVGLLGAILAAGPTFLLSGAFGIGGLGSRPNIVSGIALTWRSLSPLSALLAFAGCWVLLAPRPHYQTALGFGSAAVVVALSAVVPALGGPVVLLCAAFVTGHRAFAIGALVAGLWILGSFYYWLGLPLATKGFMLLLAGAVLAVLCVVSGLRRPPLHLGASAPTPAGIARGLIIAGALATGALAGQSVQGYETIIASGKRIYLPLAPVDPRSLIQGDYMRLNFAVPFDVRRGAPKASTFGGRRWATATLDARDVASIERISDAEPANVSGNEIVMPMRLSGGRWIVGTDAWFFQEGTAEKWQKARFGIFRVGANGTALLVGMADKDLTEIK